jgi:hypothetical protein
VTQVSRLGFCHFRLEQSEKEERLLRELLWLRHGCSAAALYGDDGEMQCSSCAIDFLRDPAELIKEKFIKGR